MASNPTTPYQVSVVVPVYNRPQQLACCLQSLFAQDFPQAHFEIIIVDDGSTDNTLLIAQQLCMAWSGSARLVHQPNGGPGSARNAGVATARAETIAFLDSDCVVTTNWLKSLIDAINELHVDGVGGPIIGAKPHHWVDNYLVACGFYRHRVRQDRVDYLITISAAFRRAALEAVGGFTAQPGIWNEDADLSFRLQASGFQLAVTHEGIATHHGTPDSLCGLARELFRYGVGNAMLSKHWGKERGLVREFIRHLGAIIAAPYLTLRLAKQVGVRRATTYWPLIVIEHAAFCYGLLYGTYLRGALQLCR